MTCLLIQISVIKHFLLVGTTVISVISLTHLNFLLLHVNIPFVVQCKALRFDIRHHAFLGSTYKLIFSTFCVIFRKHISQVANLYLNWSCCSYLASINFVYNISFFLVGTQRTAARHPWWHLQLGYRVEQPAKRVALSRSKVSFWRGGEGDACVS
jgi:hypothetical protein